jgi:hypothetical protein
MKKKRIITVIVFYLFAVCGFSQNSWYVSEFGNDNTGNGTEENPWATITFAMDENFVIDGDTIHIAGKITGDGDPESGIQVFKDLIFKGIDKETSIIEADFSASSATGRVLTIWDIAEVKLINLTIKNGYFNANSFQQGAGILNWGNLSLENCIVMDNYCENEFLGGGIYNQFGSLFLNNTYVQSNFSMFGGAGLVSEGGNVIIENTSFALNFTQQNLAGGGAIYITDNANVSISNCTLYFNLMGLNSFGAGIYIKADDGDINIDIVNTTIADNEAGAGSAGIGIYVENETSNNVNLTLKNCIVSNGTSNNFGQNGDVFTDRTNTLCRDASLPDGGVNGNIDNANPLIETFMNHGGLTPTCSIAEASPAVNAGTDVGAPETDQRGYPRNGITDMGSFEFQLNTGISKKTELSISEIYPNPTSGIANLIVADTYSDIEIELFDYFGKKVKVGFIRTLPGKIEIDLSDHPNGIYFLKIISSDGKSFETLKIIVDSHRQ